MKDQDLRKARWAFAAAASLESYSLPVNLDLSENNMKNTPVLLTLTVLTEPGTAGAAIFYQRHT
ncbi:MAG: hypothetical protein MZV70_13945 [Desulfobacterales bacterium]|nr:hypothetical protein [Desulfobacterales bacterium]